MLRTGFAVRTERGAAVRSLPRFRGRAGGFGRELLPTDACRARYRYHAEELGRDSESPQFQTETPLAYYVLQEASVLGDDGNRLGPVGSFIVGATIAAALSATDEGDLPAPLPRSIVQPNLADLLRLANEELVSDTHLANNLKRAFQPARRRVPAGAPATSQAETGVGDGKI